MPLPAGRKDSSSWSDWGVRPEHRRKGVGSGLMAWLIFTARQWKVPAITCSLDEDNLAGQLFLKVGNFKALPLTGEARSAKAIQFARAAKG